jgi:hypothetical protein
MREARQHPRIPFRFAVELFGAADRQPEHCISSNISRGGMFVDGTVRLHEEEPLRVVLGADRSEQLHLDAWVVRTNASGLACEFVGNSPATMEVLEALLAPTWDGENLLDGVMRFAPWHQDQELAGWMRLTSLVSDWQRLRQRPASPR